MRPIYNNVTTKLTGQEILDLARAHYEWHVKNLELDEPSIYDAADSLGILLDQIWSNQTAETWTHSAI